MAAEFLSPLMTEDLEDTSGGRWKLLSPLCYYSEYLASIGADPNIIVPIGFITDFASVPRVPIIFEVFGDICHKAPTVHDFLYTTKPVAREHADKVLREASIISGIPEWKSELMYLAVHEFGGNHWN